MAQGYYKLKGGASYRFTLHAANHEVILTSQSYDSKAAAEGGIESVRKNGPDAKNHEKKTSSAGQPYFVLKAANGKIIGTSEMYSSEAARDSGIASVQANSPSSTVKEE
jgi:uncharacterized protein